MYRPRADSERGAVFIHVAIGLLVLMAFSAFVVDYGMMWVSRGQAQAAADAGALAGAVSIAHDRANDSGYKARNAAWNVATNNRVWGAMPGAVPTSPYNGAPCGDAGKNSCIRVDTFRDGSNGSQLLPTFFARLFGVTTQGVRAMAVARAGVGNATTCLKPWAVIDKWVEHFPVNPATWTSTSSYDKYDNKGALDPSVGTPDYYQAPTSTSVGTGFHPYEPDGSFSSDFGRQLTLKAGDNNDFQFGTGWFKALALGGCTGGSCYNENIKGCVGLQYKIGDELSLDNEPGNKVGPTRQGVETDDDSLVNQDRGAYWDQTLNGGRGGVAGSAFATSPRIVAVPLINPDLAAEANKGGRTTVPISNIMGFFIEGMSPDNKGVIGRLMTMPSLQVAGGGEVTPDAAFMYTIQLVR